MKKRVTVSMEEELLNKLKALSKKEGRTASSQINQILKKEVKRNEEEQNGPQK